MIDNHEDRQLTNYILKFHGQFATEDEQVALLAAGWMQKATVNPNSARDPNAIAASKVQDRPLAAALLRDGWEVFRRRLRDRILRDHGHAISIHRCPACQRILRTPLARQCFWCGLDWQEQA